MNESDAGLLGQYRFKNLALEEAIEQMMSLGLILAMTCVDMAMHISATCLEFPLMVILVHQ